MTPENKAQTIEAIRSSVIRAMDFSHDLDDDIRVEVAKYPSLAINFINDRSDRVVAAAARASLQVANRLMAYYVEHQNFDTNQYIYDQLNKEEVLFAVASHLPTARMYMESNGYHHNLKAYIFSTHVELATEELQRFKDRAMANLIKGEYYNSFKFAKEIATHEPVAIELAQLVIAHNIYFSDLADIIAKHESVALLLKDWANVHLDLPAPPFPYADACAKHESIANEYANNLDHFNYEILSTIAKHTSTHDRLAPWLIAKWEELDGRNGPTHNIEVALRTCAKVSEQSADIIFSHSLDMLKAILTINAGINWHSVAVKYLAGAYGDYIHAAYIEACIKFHKDIAIEHLTSEVKSYRYVAVEAHPELAVEAIKDDLVDIRLLAAKQLPAAELLLKDRSSRVREAAALTINKHKASLPLN